MFGVSIPRQSIYGRFTKGAVTFVNEILKELLERQLSKFFYADFLSQFNHVNWQVKAETEPHTIKNG